MKCSVPLAPVLALIAGLSLTAPAARAEIIFDTGTIHFFAFDSQFGRISRDGVASNWAEQKVFPGVVNAPALFGYELFTVNSGAFSYLQIWLDDPAVALFSSAYLGAFQPVNSPLNYGLDVNYLGDSGSSQPFDVPSVFQIHVAPGSNILIPINEVIRGGGADASFELFVEGFYDTDYNDTTPTVPEPSYVIVVACAFSALVVLRRMKRV